MKKVLSKKFIDQIKQDLLIRKEKLEKELLKFTKKNTHVDGDYDSTFPEYGDKEDENAAEVVEYINNLPIEEELEKTLRDTIKTLELIQNGSYGICKYCKNLIEEKRLIARPTSASCVACKKAITKEI